MYYSKKSVIDDGEVSTSRLETLVDGVFAIAMTLLVLDIHVPELAGDLTSAQDLFADLVLLWPRVLSFIISFVILGMFWVAHHTEFRFIKKLDNKLIWQNMFYLLLVALLPFTAALLGRYPFNQTSVVLYALHLMGLVSFHYFVWRHARSVQGLVAQDVHPGIDSLVNRAAFLGIFAYLIAIVLSFFSIQTVLVIYALVPLPYIFGWIYKLGE